MVMAIIQKRKIQSRKAKHYIQAPPTHAPVMGLFPIVSLSWSISRRLVQEPCLPRGHRAGFLSILLPSPPIFPVCPPLFPPLLIISRPPLPLPTAPLSPSSPLFARLRAAPPRLSPLVFVDVVSPRLPFPSTIWTLIPPFLMTSAHGFFSGGPFSRGWWEFFPRPPFFVVGVLSLVSVTRFLPASWLFRFLDVAFPSTVCQPSVTRGAAVGASGRGVS
jgi:hypothetical protein